MWACRLAESVQRRSAQAPSAALAPTPVCHSPPVGDTMKFLHPVIGAVALSLCVWAGAQPAEVLQAARRGEADAQFRLGVLFDKGRGVVQDDDQALQWFRRAAQQGHAKAQYNLAVMLDAGRGTAPDDAQAAQWYLRAAEQGDAAAQYNLALMLVKGEGVPQGETAAAQGFLQAAQQGLAAAQFSTAMR